MLAPHLWGQLALLLGVADSREVLGLAEDYASLPKKYRDGFELHFRQLISRDLGDSVSVFLTLTFHELDGNDIWQVNIEPSDRPVYVTDGQGSVFYLRVGNATRSLPVNETVKYVQTRWGAVT